MRVDKNDRQSDLITFLVAFGRQNCRLFQESAIPIKDLISPNLLRGSIKREGTMLAQAFRVLFDTEGIN
jgi:hypothetical protein